MRWLGMITVLSIGISSLWMPQSRAADAVIYNVYRPLDLGLSNEPPPKDYFINMGAAQGVREGSILTVFRRTATYDLLSEKLYREVTFPIAKVKVIHSEQGITIARLDKLLPLETTPGFAPPAIMIGDIVRAGN